MGGHINRYEIKRNKDYAKIGRKLIREREDLHFIAESGCKIAFLSSQQEKKTGNGTKIVLGECKKVEDAYQWICPYHFLITIYEQNCFELSDEQKEILIYHELKHIGLKPDGDEIEFYVVPHDYEDFESIINEYGLNWNRVV